MQSGFGHIQFNVRDTSLPFYRDLFAFLGWTEIYADESMAGFSDSGAGSFWFTAGGKGVFAKEVQAAVLRGDADLAVHSAKDLPAVTVDGLRLACVPERGDARDALVGSTLDSLPTGATVATGSQRRRAQLAALRPDLTFVELRGNMATRLSKVPDGGAIVVAATLWLSAM